MKTVIAIHILQALLLLFYGAVMFLCGMAMMWCLK